MKTLESPGRSARVLVGDDPGRVPAPVAVQVRRAPRCPAHLDLERDPPYAREPLAVPCTLPAGHAGWHRNQTGGRVVLRLPGIVLRLVAGDVEWETIP